MDHIHHQVQTHDGLEATVDLPRQEIMLHLPEEKTFTFEIDPGVKEQLVKGLDDIDLTLQDRFEKDHRQLLY